MSNYSKIVNPKKTKQSDPIPGRETEQAQNNAGGYVFSLDDWARLDRFLILGSDAPTYYQTEQKLTRENAAVVVRCWGKDPKRTAETIFNVSHNGRAPRQSPGIFALALGVSHETEKARVEAFKIVSGVCRTASTLFELVSYVGDLRGGRAPVTGSGWKRAVYNWYASKSTEALAYQFIKYRRRNNLEHKHLIEMAHVGVKNAPKERQELFKWVRGKDFDFESLPDQVKGHIEVMGDAKEKRKLTLISDLRLPREALNTDDLRNPKVWLAMLPSMPMTALMRNLGNMSEIGVIKPNSEALKEIQERFSNPELIKKSRLHPFSILQALAVYQSGSGFRGGKKWPVEGRIVDALDAAFYLAFDNVESTGRRFILALDVSGSMGSAMIGSPLTCREASAAMALVTMAREPNCHVVGFTSGSSRSMWGSGSALRPLDISPRMRLGDVVRKITNIPFGGTDCSLPMRYAEKEKIPTDAFVVYTDNETWAGDIHASQALKNYRKATGIQAKMAVVGMTSTGFSIADPKDGGMMDFVGFDSAAPAVLSDFVR